MERRAPAPRQRSSNVTTVRAEKQYPRLISTIKTFNIQHMELISSVIGNQAGLQINTTLNPRNPLSFPWLSNVARSFDMWLPMAVQVTYRPRSGTLVPGRVALAFDYDVTDDDNSISFTNLMSMAGAVSGPVYEQVTLNYEPTRTVMTTHKYFCDSTGVDRLDSPARLLVMCDSSTVGPLGDVYIAYQISLVDPEAPLQTSSPGVYARASNSGDRSQSAPLGSLEGMTVSLLNGQNHDNMIPTFTKTINNAIKLKGDVDRLLGAFTPLPGSMSMFKLPRKTSAMPPPENMVFFVMNPESGTCSVNINLLFLYKGDDDTGQPPSFEVVCNYPTRTDEVTGPTITANYYAFPCNIQGLSTGPAVFNPVLANLATGWWKLHYSFCATALPELEPFLFSFYFIGADLGFSYDANDRHCSYVKVDNTANPAYYSNFGSNDALPTETPLATSATPSPPQSTPIKTTTASKKHKHTDTD